GARPRSGSTPLPDETDVAQPLSAAVSLLHYRLGSGLTVHAALPDGNVRARISADHLQQIAIKLISNAIDAMSGRGCLQIRCLTDPGGAVVIEFADDGTGVPPEVRERLFEPYRTTKPPGRGTGLGLAISRELAQGAGGSLDLVEADGGAPWPHSVR